MKKCVGVVYLLLFSSLIFNSVLMADDTDTKKERVVPEIKATKINPHAPKIDGFLDDEIWKSAKLELADDFLQRQPDDGQPETESTLVAVVYDEDAIYFAFWCYDSEPEKIARQMVRRDRFGEADLIAVRIDPFHDHQNGYQFYVNAAGVQCDGRLYNENNSDDSWDAVWVSDVQIQPWGWSVEMKIPYNCIRFPKKDEHVWGVDFARAINRKDESSRWAHVPISEGGYVSNFGHLTGIKGIKPARHLEVLPYTVSSYETQMDYDDYMGNVGVDIKYGLSSNLTLDATINPDFGQVELDRPVLNLSAYETYYSERRPFFMEGSDLFSAEYNLFYSRRIGRPPSQSVEDTLEICEITEPRATTILGAAKLTGKLSSGTSIAIVGAVTQKEMAQYKAITSADTTVIDDSTMIIDNIVYEDREGVVEPQAVYSAFRIKQDIFNNSSVGGILTLASQDTRHPAMTGAVDWRLFTKNNGWSFRGQSVFSRVDNEKTGFATDLVFEKNSGKYIRGALGFVIKDRGLNINRLGYTSRNNYKGGWMWMQYRTSDDWWIVRDSWNNFNLSASWNFEGYNIGKSWNFNNCIQFTNNWMGGMGFNQSHGEYNDYETWGNVIWQRPKAWNAWVWLDTDERRKLSFEVDYGFGNSRTSPWWSGEFLIRYRPTSTMQFVLYTEYTHDFGQLMYTFNDGDTSYFADKDQNIFDMSFTVSMMINRNLSCQLSANGLLTGLDYNNYRPYIPHGQYGPAVSDSLGNVYDGYLDRNVSALNSTLLIRWEYNPGSTIYLVWTRSRGETDRSLKDLDIARDYKKWFSGGAYNVFLIKASYWMNI